MLNEYFREGNYHKIIELYENKMPSDVSDINEVRKVAESYRRLGKIKDSICWMERLVTLQPDNRYLDKLKELYLQIQPSTEQWKWFWKVSEGKSKECAMIAEYFYEKENGADIEHRKKLLRDMLSVVSYEDEIYFEAVELLDKKYYLNEILKRTNKAASHHKAEAMLNEIKKAEKKENKKSFAKHLIERIKREVPLSIEELFSDIVGMGNIQEEIGALYQHLKVNNNRIDQIAIPYNFIIGGQKGSGKTRLAYIIAELLYTTDLSRVREPLEVSAISLLENMEELLKNAPPVVIINNTECLWKSSTLETDNVKADGDNNQVWLLLEQLLEEGVYSQEHFYIFLGESEAMDSLLSNNAKIRNLVTYLKIPVYTSEELHRIGLKMIAKDGYEITKDGSEQFYQEIRKKSVLGDFANGHTIQNLIIEAKKNMAYRISNEGGTRCFDARDFVILDTSQESLEELLQQLHALTGLETVKEEVEGKLALYRKREEDRKAGIACEEEESQTLNTLLLGPPGTGKTTVARLLGKIYSAIGILPRGDIFVEVTRDGLVAGYSGQTALKVDEAVKKAMGGVLFIDEAYNLVNGEHDEFGKEAVSVLLTRAENYRDRLMIIMAGYEEPMNKLLSINEGMERRFPHKLHFENYTEDELWEIFCAMLQKRGYTTNPDADMAIKRLIKGRMCRSNFGNAGEIRNILDGLIQKLAVRVLEQRILQNADRRAIRKIDVDEYIGHETESEKTLEDYLDEMNQLTGLWNVKKHIMDQIKSSRIAQERARRAGVPYSPGTLHMLLVGNAGTGKTTIARLIGKIYGKAGLIKNEDVFVEIRRESLVAGYMGQTGAKVIKEVERATGGIMFIDEAYNLVNGEHDEFGKDALNTLIAPIENNRDDLMVIMAGYEEEMEELLNHNQGLRSRINTKLILEDYSLDQMVEIFYEKAKHEGYKIEEGLRECVAAYIQREQEKAYPDFGNARGVRNCFEAVTLRMNARLAACEDELLSDSQLMRLSDEEISTIRRVDFEGE